MRGPKGDRDKNLALPTIAVALAWPWHGLVALAQWCPGLVEARAESLGVL